jgi:hypothetical protein
VELGHDEERYALDEGDPLELLVRGERHRVAKGEPLLLPRP